MDTHTSWVPAVTAGEGEPDPGSREPARSDRYAAVLELGEGQLRRTLPALAVVSGLAAAIGATAQWWFETGDFRPWALVGHLLLVGLGLGWWQRPPRLAHRAGLLVVVYLITMVASFALASGRSGTLMHLGVISVGCFCFLVDWRYQLAVQAYVLACFAFTFARMAEQPDAPSHAILTGILFCGGFAIHFARLHVLDQLVAARRALDVEADQRRRAQDQALAAQKLESLGVMAGGIAHDFNNLLVGIVGGADLALDARDEPDELGRALDTVRAAASSAQELCRELLDYAGGRPVPLTPTDLNAAVEEALRIVAPSLPDSVHVAAELGSDLPPVLGERAHLSQLVVNLVSNAAEAFGDGGGKIGIGTRLDGGPGAPLLLYVADDGPGIPAEIRSRIFDPFFTTKFTGRGLGLATVAATVRLHGGRMDLHSSARGTRFEIRLPVAKLEDASAQERTEHPDWSGCGAILLVDDEPVVLRTGDALLRGLGFEVCCAHSGVEAVEIVRQDPGRFRAAIVDATMPVLDGAATLRRLRELAPDLKVLLSSGFSAPPGAVPLPSDDPVPFLAKPYGRADLARALRSLLAES